MGYLERLMGENEVAVFKTRQHWLVIFWGLVIHSIISLLIVIGVVLAVTVTHVALWVALPIGLLLLLFPVWRLSLTLLHWWNEVYVVTNRRVIQLEGIFNKHSIDSSLEKVNDVVLEQSFTGRMMDYGNVEILTASEVGVNRFDMVARPVKFKTEMLNQKEKLGEPDEYAGRAKKVLTGEAPSTGDVPELIAELDELRKKGIISEAEFQKKKEELLKKI
jgi:uncharacterized membrane protein YdbT with pleckstrin-like domain